MGWGRADRSRKQNPSTLRASWSFQSSERPPPTLSCPPYLEEKMPEAMPTARIPRREQWSWAARSCWSFLSGETQGSPLATHFPTSPSLFAIASNLPVVSPSPCSPPHFAQCISRTKPALQVKLKKKKKKILENLKRFTQSSLIFLTLKHQADCCELCSPLSNHVAGHRLNPFSSTYPVQFFSWLT